MKKIIKYKYKSLLYFSIFRVRKGVDHWIIGTRCFGQNHWKFADERSDLGRVAPSSKQADDGKGSPGHHPNGHVHNSDLCGPDFSRNGLLLIIGPQRSDVHLLSLLPQLVLVMENGLNDEVIAAGDDNDRYDVNGNKATQNVSLVVHRLSQSIKRAPIK